MVTLKLPLKPDVNKLIFLSVFHGDELTIWSFSEVLAYQFNVVFVTTAFYYIQIRGPEY